MAPRLCAALGVLLVSSGGAQAVQLGAGECHDLGFSDVLGCSKCLALQRYLPQGDPLIDECEKCCEPDAGVSTTYASARLEVCQ